MKKIMTILIPVLALTLLVSACAKKPAVNMNANTNQNINSTPTPTPSPSAMTEIDTSNWQTYRNEEIGLELKYPLGYEVVLKKELDSFDIGKKREILIKSTDGQNILPINIMVTSKDYSEGVGEGCCFYYSGRKVNSSLSIQELSLLLEKFQPFNLHKRTVEDLNALEFYRINSYVDFWGVESILIPYAHIDFANILISGPTLIVAGTPEDVKKYILDEKYLQDKEKVGQIKLFNKIISTMKFNIK